MATQSVAIHNDNLDVNDKLARALRDAESALESCSSIFGQLAALFRATETGGVRSAELLALGQYVADDWANTADSFRESAKTALNEAGA